VSEATSAGPGFPRLALGLAWSGSIVATGIVGWQVGGPPGRWLTYAAVLGLVATGAVVSNRLRPVTLAFSAIASLVTIGVGVVAADLAATAFGAVQAIAIGAATVIGGLVTARLSRRAWRMAQD
jgi:hypothetical protein